MAADMTDETIAQYMERIEKMSIKEIQKEIEFLESPGYNCEGLVCADGVITDGNAENGKDFYIGIPKNG